jgi:hypothetical protein
MTGMEKAARLQRALDYSGATHRISDVVALIKTGHATLWECDDGVIVTELHTFPLFKAVNYWLVAGRLRDCLALEDQITPWALGEGCTVATACGRRGWERSLTPAGWQRRPLCSYVKPLVSSHE